jgi:drug/metabolite transporter (DMT)-like permease
VAPAGNPHGYWVSGESAPICTKSTTTPSWLGTLCWNEASQRLPTALVGQLIVFETLSALAYAFMLRGRLPEAETLAGIALLVAGVLWALRVRPEPTSECMVYPKISGLIPGRRMALLRVG